MKQRKTVLAALLAAALLPWLTVSAKAADTDVMFSDPSVVVGNSVTVNVYTTSAVAGIDLTDKSFWEQGLQILADEIDQFIALLEK